MENNIIGLVIGIVGSIVATIILYWLDISVDAIFLKVQRKLPAGFLIFITGTNGVGKTTTAINVSKRLGGKYIEVNMLRDALRSQENLYISAGQEDSYKILSLPTYLLNHLENLHDINNDTDYQKQCELLSPVIKWVATYYTRQNVSTVLEGVNISTHKLLNSGITNSKYILFVNLYVSDNKALLKRLYKKANGKAYNRSIYDNNFDNILNTAKTIQSDFDNNKEIHKISIDTTNLSVRKVTKAIIKEAKSICKDV